MIVGVSLLGWGVASAATVDVCPAEQLSPSCVGLQQAVEDASRTEQTVLELRPGVYRGPVRVLDGRDIVLQAVGDVTFAASASDPRMDGFVAQIEVLDGAITIDGLTLSPVNLGSVYIDEGMTGLVEGVSVAPSGSGWGLWVESGDLVVRDALFVGGLAYDGAHLLANGSTVRLEGSELVSGVSINSGGSVAVGADTTLDVIDCRFADNRSDQGGAISAGEAVVHVRGTQFERNRADIDGGAVQLIGGSLDIENGDFRDNSADNGGAISVRNGEVALRVSSFCKNAADATGGALDTGALVEALLTNNRFLDNGAVRGGALAIRAPGTTVAYASFLGNVATADGSAVWVTGDADVSLQSVLMAHQAGALAATVSEEGVLNVDNAVLFENGLGDLGLEVEATGLRREDPQLRGYQPGQSCGLSNDFHSEESPLAIDESDVEPPSEVEPTCSDPATFNREGILVDEVPDWGAYGGVCGFTNQAWADFDGDFFPALYDCNDRDASVNPGVDEIWYDGIDQDCNGGSDFDQDDDGEDRVPEGSDCDDTDRTVRKGVTDDNPLRDLDCDFETEDDPLEYRRERIRCAVGPATSPVGMGLMLGLLAMCLGPLRSRDTA